jgi:hypothetical protein
MKKLLAMTLALSAVAPFAACRVEKVEEGRAPTVEVEPGKLPDYDVDTAKVEVKSRAAEVNVPNVDVDVKRETKEVQVPDVDVVMPSERGDTDTNR